jgi:hypothetical protein
LAAIADVHGIDPASGEQDTVKGFPHQVFKDTSGNVMVNAAPLTSSSLTSTFTPAYLRRFSRN